MSTSVELKRFAAQIRMETVKCLIHRGFGHIGGCLSIADVLAALYGKLMHVDPADRMLRRGIIWWCPKDTQDLRSLPHWL